MKGPARSARRYNVRGARASTPKVIAMWYMWFACLLVSWSLAAEGAPAQATTQPPPRTLDRGAGEQYWRAWLENGLPRPDADYQKAPPRRITTKSLFITPYICKEEQRLDPRGCSPVVTVDKEEHERLLLGELKKLVPSTDYVAYDYGDGDSGPGPLQLSIPIGLDPQAAPLQAHEPDAKGQKAHGNVDKKDEKPDIGSSLEAELELLQLQLSQKGLNDTMSAETTDILNHDVLQNLDKPKRDSPTENSTENYIDEGQKEVVYGHVNIDPILAEAEAEVEDELFTTTDPTTDIPTERSVPILKDSYITDNNTTVDKSIDNTNKTETRNATFNVLKKDTDETKLNPENDYADIGEAIKLISRYAEVTTDDNYNNKDQKKYASKDDSILGTRTKLQYRRNKPKPAVPQVQPPLELLGTERNSLENKMNSNRDFYYRYPVRFGQNSPTPPPNYPFRHVQDYWPGRSYVGGVYSTGHENPRRHHHNYPHNYFRAHDPYVAYQNPYIALPKGYPEQLSPPSYGAGAAPYHSAVLRAHTNNQDLYTLLGLRHWFSSEGTSKR